MDTSTSPQSEKNPGLAMMEAGDLAGARDAFEQALTLDEDIFGPESKEVAADARYLGNVLCRMGDFAGARPHFERALRISQTMFGPEFTRNRG